ncbi:MAG: GDP-mannose 4,6-dehydratase, partial [Rikenellaceae bacterium]
AERVGAEFLEAMLNRIGDRVVEVDAQYFRPTEVELLIGDPTKSNTVLGWKPEYDLKGLIEEMMVSDVKLMKKDAYLKAGGYQTLNYFE